jgi:hypothetical protein
VAAKGSTTSPFSFGGELAAYQKWFVDNRQTFNAWEYDIGSRVLERWQGHNPNEILEIWNKICSRILPGQRPPNPADFAWQFIGTVIWRRAVAETYKTILHAEPELRAKIAERRRVHLKHQDYDSLIRDGEEWKRYSDIRRRAFSDENRAASVLYE